GRGKPRAGPAIILIKSRRRIASPQGSEQGMVAGQTGRLEVAKTALSNVRFGSKADMAAHSSDVRFTSKSGHWNSVVECSLCAINVRFASRRTARRCTRYDRDRPNR